MLDIEDRGKVADVQEASSAQEGAGKLKHAVSRIVKKVPQLALLAATVAFTVPDTMGGLPGHRG
jgi:hypothetical protein